MQQLTEHQKKIIIDLTVNDYEEKYSIFTRSKLSKNLQEILKSEKNSLQYKWEAVEWYLQRKDQTNQTLAIIIRNAIEAATKEASLLSTLKIGNFNDNDLNYFTESTRKNILNRATDVQDWNYTSVELVDTLKQANVTLAAKWQALVSYLRNRHNRDYPLYHHLEAVIAAHNIEQDHYGHGYEHVIAARATENASTKVTEYQTALQFYKKISLKEDDRDTHIAECELHVGDYQSSFLRYDRYVNEWKNQYPNQMGPYREKRNQALDGSLKKGTYLNYMSSQNRRGETTHTMLQFGQSFGKGLYYGAMPGLCVIGLSGIGEIFLFLLLFPVGVALTATGLLVGGVVGAAHGFFRANNRCPLDTPLQDQLITKLQNFTHQSKTAKEQLIDNIVREYRITRSCSASDSSTALFNRLSGDDDPDIKWQALEYYMLERDGSFYKNNGKKLFCIINRALDDTRSLMYSPI